MKNPKTLMRRIVLVLFLFVAAYGGGTIIGLIIQQAAPEPGQCALHDLAGRYHAPVLMNLATGEIVEMRVYEPDPARPWEISAFQRTGYFQQIKGAGLSGYRDGGIVCHVDLPQVGEAMNNELFCRKCRLMLSMANGKDYAILDLYDPERMTPYVVTKGKEYEINGYTVSIEKGRLPFSLTVSTRGHLYDRQNG